MRAAVGWLAALFLLAATGCAHHRTRSGLLAAGAEALSCDPAKLLVTEYGPDSGAGHASLSGEVEGCDRRGNFIFLSGRWRLDSRCSYRVTPSIQSCCSPNRGGERTCVAECSGLEQCGSGP